MSFSLLIFLLLVGGGFIILSCKILFEKSLLWVFGANMALLFMVLYTVQFLDLGAIAAEYNVFQWEQEPTRQLDEDYLKSQGASGWEALRRAAAKPERGADSLKAFEALTDIHSHTDAVKPVGNWRSWQARRSWNLHHLLSRHWWSGIDTHDFKNLESR